MLAPSHFVSDALPAYGDLVPPRSGLSGRHLGDVVPAPAVSFLPALPELEDVNMPSPGAPPPVEVAFALRAVETLTSLSLLTVAFRLLLKLYLRLN